MAQDKNGRLGRESKAYITIRMQAGHSAARPPQRVKAQSSGDRCVLQQVRPGKQWDWRVHIRMKDNKEEPGRAPF